MSTSRNLIKRNLHVAGVLSYLKLNLKMNGPAMALFLAQTKNAQERKLICKRKRDARRRFQAYVRRRGVVTQLFVLLLTRNFFQRKNDNPPPA